MDIYFSPEFIKEEAQLLNIVTDRNEPIGYLSFLIDEKKLYVFALVEQDGVLEDFKDLVKPYIQGLVKIKPDLEVLTYLNAGGKKVELEMENEK
ncbi:hypothetical protein [Bacillus sp. FJAT-45350]|uniref:hypothetical protein n=1 Tax=Bacillus sp. FJAT-45350 TaxID=2011014 RepID=UPI000BB80996|nr:hypothetical protein [Bacillus sp. FJAT-45350]